jgi:hypothetical protein
LKKFGSLEMVRQANEDALSQIIGPAAARRVRQTLAGEPKINVS